MMSIYEYEGLKIEHPSDWDVEVEGMNDGWSVSLQSPGTAFVVVTYCPGADDVTYLGDAALTGLQDTFSGVEPEDTLETIDGQPSVGYDVRFFHLDFTNTAWIRTLAVDEGGLLIMAQCTDQELPTEGPMIKHIIGSIKIVDE